MRKLFIVFALVLLWTGVAFAVPDEGNRMNLKETSGVAGEPVRVYTFVRYPEQGADTSALASGDVVVWDLISADGITVNIVGYAGGSTSTDAVAGVCVGTIQTADSASTTQTIKDSLGDRNWGWIQIYGLMDGVDFDDSAVTAGELIRASATATKACGVDAAGQGDLGFAYEASSATGNKKAFIRCR